MSWETRKQVCEQKGLQVVPRSKESKSQGKELALRQWGHQKPCFYTRLADLGGISAGAGSSRDLNNCASDIQELTSREAPSKRKRQRNRLHAQVLPLAGVGPQ